MVSFCQDTTIYLSTTSSSSSSSLVNITAHQLDPPECVLNTAPGNLKLLYYFSWGITMPQYVYLASHIYA
uniref:Uncharacterized protein n=1 Tax=Anguilla anguilla TaxID=7936 RepID=A0A0E9SA26_ANGAN